MACKPSWVDSPKPQCKVLSKSKRKLLVKILDTLRYHPASLTTEEALEDILHIVEVQDGIIH